MTSIRVKKDEKEFRFWVWNNCSVTQDSNVMSKEELQEGKIYTAMDKDKAEQNYLFSVHRNFFKPVIWLLLCEKTYVLTLTFDESQSKSTKLQGALCQNYGSESWPYHHQSLEEKGSKMKLWCWSLEW